MENKNLRWCFKLKDGLRIVDQNERLSTSYLEQARLSLLKAERDFSEKDFLWTTVTLYYAEYYSLYAFLQRIGIKCENHACSIIAISFLLGEEKTKIINQHKDKRIDAQYYMKVDQESKIRLMLQEAKEVVADFDNLISNLSEDEIKKYRRRMLDASR